MTVEAAIRAVAKTQAVADTAVSAWQSDAETLEQLGVNTDNRRAMLIGQCAHESGRFVYRSENLNYSTDALWRVFRGYFQDIGQANEYARQPERIANRVYANRMGNGNEASGDGWKYRGRGYLQLTGKSNYTAFGKALGLDLVGNPDLAAEPSVSWRIAARYCASRKRSGKTLLQWADVPDEVMVTKGINGGTNGLQDRIELVDRALSALTGKITVIEEQRLLAQAGFDPGTIDGLMGPNTQKAIDGARAKLGVAPPELWDKLRKVG